MFLANFQTRNFSFTALGNTEAEARKALEGAWARHAANTGAVSFEEIGGQDDVNIDEMQPGDVICDGYGVVFSLPTEERPWVSDGHCTECGYAEDFCRCPCINCGCPVSEHGEDDCV